MASCRILLGLCIALREGEGEERTWKILDFKMRSDVTKHKEKVKPMRLYRFESEKQRRNSDTHTQIHLKGHFMGRLIGLKRGCL